MSKARKARRERRVTPLAIVGRGKVGRALARAIRGAGGQVSMLRGDVARPRSTLRIFVLCVPDDAIAEVAARLAPRIDADSIVLHCAGARGTDELDACRATGAAVGVMHPLVSFAHPAVPPVLDGATFVCDGDPRAIRAARYIAELVGARPLVAPILGPAYHAAAALCANGAAALSARSLDVLAALGVGEREGRAALAGLLRSVADNVESLGAHALTGPVRRGDLATVHAHRTAIASVPGAAAAYDAILPVLVGVAEQLE